MYEKYSTYYNNRHNTYKQLYIIIIRYWNIFWLRYKPGQCIQRVSVFYTWLVIHIYSRICYVYTIVRRAGTYLKIKFQVKNPKDCDNNYTDYNNIIFGVVVGSPEQCRILFKYIGFSLVLSRGREENSDIFNYGQRDFFGFRGDIRAADDGKRSSEQRWVGSFSFLISRIVFAFLENKK